MQEHDQTNRSEFWTREQPLCLSTVTSWSSGEVHSFSYCGFCFLSKDSYSTTLWHESFCHKWWLHFPASLPFGHSGKGVSWRWSRISNSSHYIPQNVHLVLLLWSVFTKYPHTAAPKRSSTHHTEDLCILYSVSWFLALIPNHVWKNTSRSSQGPRSNATTCVRTCWAFKFQN
jgi:hypothetical protein